MAITEKYIEVKTFNVYLYCDDCKIKMIKVFREVIRPANGLAGYAGHAGGGCGMKNHYVCKNCGTEKQSNLDFPYLKVAEV